MATEVNVTALPEYVAQRSDELLIRAMTESPTLKHIGRRLGVKHKEVINFLDSTVTFQDGSTCGFNPTGSDTFSQRILEVKPIKVNKQWCPQVFLPVYLNQQLEIAAGRETLPAEAKIVESNLSEIREELEKLIWNGDTTLGISGLLAQLKAETGTIDVSVAAGSTASQIIDATYQAIPDEVFVRGDVTIFVNPTIYRQYISEQNATCCANRDIINAAAESIVLVGDSRVRIVPVPGLIGFNGAVAVYGENLVYGTDIEDSQAIYKLWFSDDDDVFKFKVLFNAGTQIIYPDEVVLTAVAAAANSAADAPAEDAHAELQDEVE